ncbi:LLM class flavin-dependent oxidoreductase [Gilvimarinus sp. DA14]|uniref:LLM class flavin-dependent oxidoreductase n=1 Tax=Gilvimarinus sp. DA14 TaxID=2956798 RepID=UPI0020B8BD9B|nr:LLM class flavin-dependent oxidoreductase [Gilvimarinus sp. DA14]UTF61634.1 LLM class flavin-dependent oxidoreductase [Gilvimarinus sp. DA14]
MSTAYSILDLAHAKLDASYRDAYQRVVEAAQYAERLGYTRFWLAEHHSMEGIGSSATSVLIGHIAGATESIRVGAGGIMLPNHAPIIIAEHFGTLAELYPQRIDLGLGRAPGSDGATMRALRRDFNSGVDDFPEQLAELQYFLGDKQPGQKVFAAPGMNSDIPIWLLGSSLYSAQLAAKRGLPFAFASHFAPRLLMEALHVYRSGFQPSAVLDKPYAAIGVPVCAADTDARARYLHTTAQQSVLALLRGEHLRLRPPVESMDNLWTPQEQMHINEFNGIAAVGSPETIKDHLIELKAETGADEFIFASSFYEQSDRLRSLEIVAEVMKGV